MDWDFDHVHFLARDVHALSKDFEEVFGMELLSFEEAVEVFQKFTLEGVAEQITCPLLIVHGENDRQVGLAQAEMTYEAAVNSPKRELKVFTLADTGAEHCQVDNTDMFVDYAAHWVAETLGAQG